ncbi:hypothetical protein ACLB2K_026194 [Fragaria x ananassa]
MSSRMRQQGLVGNNLTFIFIFKACTRVSDVVCGQKAQAYALKLGFESYMYVSNALIHMYLSCGDLGYAQKVFDEMRERDLVSWNSLICGYSQGNMMIDMYGRRGLPRLAREVFDRMRERNVVSWNAMINVYAKVENLVDARKLFDRMPNRDVISWTSMITGYSQANQHAEAVSLFREMMAANVRPDKVTVAGVLSACAHVGSLNVGEAVHEYIRKHGVKTDVYVGNALIDMYCKCGVAEKALAVFQGMDKKDSVSWTSVISGLVEAYKFMQNMPMVPDAILWRILLGACQVHGNLALAEIVSNKLIELDPSNSGNYILSSNNYALSHRWDCVAKMRGLMDECNVQKPFGSSSIEINDAL